MKYLKKLKSLIDEKNGLILTKDIVNEGIPRECLNQLLRENKLERIVYEVYLTPDAFDDEMYRIQARNRKFKGTIMTEFLDRAEYTGDIFSQLNDAIEFIKKHINYGGKIEGLQRTDQYEIPLVGIREAVVNTLVYRDYQNYGRDIKIGIYDDILDIVLSS